MREASSRFVRFILVGGAMSAVNLGLLALLVEIVRIPYLLACLVSFFLLNFAGYLLNKSFSFGLGATPRTKELLSYYIIMATSLVLNLFGMYVLVDVFGAHYILASVLITVPLAIFNYAGHTIVTFRKRVGKDPQRRLRVLQVSAFYPLHGGGIEAVAGYLARGLSDRGIHVTWMAGGAPNEWPASTAAMSVRPVTSLDVLERRLGLPWPIWSPGGIVRLAVEIRQADVVHIHDALYMGSLCAFFFAKAAGRPVVLTQHIGAIEFSSRKARWLLSVLNRSVVRVVLQLADQTVFVGKPVMEYFERFVRFSRPPALIANGVDHAAYHPVPRDDCGQPPTFLFVGRFVEKKGVALLTECAGRIQVKWVFVGHGPLVPSGSNFDGSGFSVRENLRASDVIPYYQRADLLVLPSKGEGFPLVVQEALACGTPVLVSGEVAAAFPSSDARCVFSVDLDASGFRARLESLLRTLAASPDVLAQARHPAAQLAAQWSWTACLDRYEAIYRRLSAAD